MNYKELFGEEWYEALKGMIDSEYWVKLGQTVAQDRKIREVYPEKGSDLLFKAFRTTQLSKVKVVILGQDPYHDGSYDGYAFSNSLLKKGRVSPSLQNILKEVHDDIYPEIDYEQWFTVEQIDLERWAKQGVLLINTAHTVVKGAPDSHTALWKRFTQFVIQTIILKRKNVVWILWGNRVKNLFWSSIDYILQHDKRFFVFDYEYIMKDSLVIQSPHPSPFSAYTGFFGSKPFSRTNEYLKNKNISQIIW